MSEIDQLIAVATDAELDVIDALRHRAGIVWTHRGGDHVWTQPKGEPCEQCGAREEAAP